jgi:mRNA interferase MazF
VKEADVVLTPLPQAEAPPKNRPALILREMPPFGDFLVCGISTQVHQAVPGFDKVISRTDADFAGSGPLADSVIRVGFLAVLPRKKLLGGIGSVDRSRHARLLRNLSRHLLAEITKAPNQ